MGQGEYSIPELEQQEQELVLQAFSNEDAWRIGSRLVERALREQAPIAVDLRRADHVLFRSVLAGATADQAAWIQRKSATAFRFQSSSLLFGQRMAAQGRDAFADGWLDPARYTVAGGSFPIRVSGAGMVGAFTVSGLSSYEDHTLILDTLRDVAG